MSVLRKFFRTGRRARHALGFCAMLVLAAAIAIGASEVVAPEGLSPAATGHRFVPTTVVIEARDEPQAPTF